MARIGERLKMARRMAGLSQRALANSAGVSAMAISKYERGLTVPGSAVLIRLARALGVKVEFFLRPVNINLTAPASHGRSSLPLWQDEAILARVQEWLERYLEAESLFGEVLAFGLPDGFDRDVACLEDVERVSMDLRQAWHLGWDPIENLTEILEDHGVRVGQVEGQGRFEVLTLWANDAMPIIVVEQDLSGDSQRYDMAYELGQIVLRSVNGVGTEKAAHRFARAFLVPEPAARFELGNQRLTLSLLELHLLKHKYGLSMQAWVYRAQDLGILSETSTAQLFREFHRRGWHRSEPGGAFPPEEPARLKRLVLRALAEGVISESRAAELLGVPVAHFWSQEGAQHAVFPVAVRG